LGVLTLLAALIPALVLLAAALVIVSQNRVNDNSPGALDNATALVAIFMTLDQLPPAAPVGVIFPDAEEYGLVGPLAFLEGRAGAAVGGDRGTPRGGRRDGPPDRLHAPAGTGGGGPGGGPRGPALALVARHCRRDRPREGRPRVHHVSERQLADVDDRAWAR